MAAALMFGGGERLRMVDGAGLSTLGVGSEVQDRSGDTRCGEWPNLAQGTLTWPAFARTTNSIKLRLEVVW